MPKIQILVLSLCALMAAGCSGIGDGSSIERVRIIQNTGQVDEALTQIDAFTCVRSSLTLVAEFTQGDIGNFSNRAVWTSSNRDVLRVTNFNEPANDGTDDVFLIGGVLLPQQASDVPVTVRAEYLGLRAEVQVTVKAATDVRILPPIARLVPETVAQYVVRAKLDGVDTDITPLTTLSFVEPNDEVVLVSSQAGLGVVRGIKADPKEFVLKADTGVPCAGLDSAQAITIVAEPLTVDLDYERGFESGMLAEGTSQFLQLRARFGDFVDNDGNPVPDGDQDDQGEYQDLSNQFGPLFGYDADGDGTCELRLEDPGTEASPNAPAPVLLDNGRAAGFAGLSLVTAAIDTNTVPEATTVCADFGGKDATTGTDAQPAENGRLSNTLPLAVVDAALTDFTLSASDLCIPGVNSCLPLGSDRDLSVPRVKSGDLLRLDVTGTFDGGYTQSITKNVRIVSSNPQLASVFSGISRDAGIIITNADLDSVEGCDGDVCQVTFTVTWSANTIDPADDRSKTIVLTVERAADDELP